MNLWKSIKTWNFKILSQETMAPTQMNEQTNYDSEEDGTTSVIVGLVVLTITIAAVVFVGGYWFWKKGKSATKAVSDSNATFQIGESVLDKFSSQIDKDKLFIGYSTETDCKTKVEAVKDTLNEDGKNILNDIKIENFKDEATTIDKSTIFICKDDKEVEALKKNLGQNNKLPIDMNDMAQVFNKFKKNTEKKIDDNNGGEAQEQKDQNSEDAQKKKQEIETKVNGYIKTIKTDKPTLGEKQYVVADADIANATPKEQVDIVINILQSWYESLKLEEVVKDTTPEIKNKVLFHADMISLEQAIGENAKINCNSAGAKQIKLDDIKTLLGLMITCAKGQEKAAGNVNMEEQKEQPIEEDKLQPTQEDSKEEQKAPTPQDTEEKNTYTIAPAGSGNVIYVEASKEIKEAGDAKEANFLKIESKWGEGDAVVTRKEDKLTYTVNSHEIEISDDLLTNLNKIYEAYGLGKVTDIPTAEQIAAAQTAENDGDSKSLNTLNTLNDLLLDKSVDILANMLTIMLHITNVLPVKDVENIQKLQQILQVFIREKMVIYEEE